MVKYWNFTTLKPTYYTCPNPKYPHLKFIIKEHPNDFCIPCCQKSKISKDKKNKKRIIHDICMTSHIYSKDKVSIVAKSRYIMTYGKDIGVGRVSKLPELTLDPLFSMLHSSANINEKDICNNKLKYLLFGVEQNTKTQNNIGVLFCIAEALGKSAQGVVGEILKGWNIKQNNNLYSILLNGNMNKYFTNSKDFIIQMGLLAENGHDIVGIKNLSHVWNSIFIELSLIIFDINCITFNDSQRKELSLGMGKNITEIKNIFGKTDKNIFILNKRGKYYPIFLFNMDIFSKTGTPEKKIFFNSDEIIVSFMQIIKTNLLKNQIIDKKNINLEILEKFANRNESKFLIKKLFINKSGWCYAAGVQSKYSTDKMYVYMPLTDSVYNIKSDQYNLVYTPFKRANCCSIGKLGSFLSAFNKWRGSKFSHIMAEKWLRYKNGIIGFRYGDFNYYFYPKIRVESITKNKLKHNIDVDVDVKFKIINLVYDPDKINDIMYHHGIASKHTHTNDKFIKSKGKILYDFYLYRLFLMSFMKAAMRRKNMLVREKIKKIVDDNFKTKEKFDANLSALNISKSDRQIIVKAIYISKKPLHVEKFIKNNTFDFDRNIINNLQNNPKERNIKFLKKFSRDIVKIVSEESLKGIHLDNIIEKCGKDTQSGACYGDKLKISSKKLNEFISVLADDISNPLKSEWIFDPISLDPVINKFKFSRNPLERITIRIESKYKFTFG